MRFLAWLLVAIIAVPPGAALLDGLHTRELDGADGSQRHDAAPGQAEQRAADAGDFGVRFDCPTVGSGATGQEIIDATTCPYYIRDEHDIMSQPTLVIDPHNDHCQAFHAMHGGRGVHAPGTPQPPSYTSRDNDLHQPHTLFRWCNDGGWEDNPYYVHESISVDGRIVFGEDNDAVTDKSGNIVLGGVVAYQGVSDAAYQYVVVLHRLGRANTQPGYDNPTVIETENPYAVISDLAMTYVRKTDTIAVSWVETDPAVNGGEPERRVRTAWSLGANQGVWRELGFSDRIGPCIDISEMVSYETIIYVACRPAPGYFGDGNFTPRFVQMQAIDTATWHTWHVSQTPISDGHIKLIDGYNGWQVLMGSGVDANNRPFAEVTFGPLGDKWSDIEDYAADFMDAADAEAQGSKMVDARITAAVHDDTNHLVHLIWAEWYQLDPLDPDTVNAQPLAKTYAVVRAMGGFLGSFDMGYGTASRAVTPQAGYQGGEDGVFFDNHDSIVRWRDPRGGADHLWVAFGDYGSVRHTQAIPTDPPLPIAFPPAAIPAIPLAAASGTTSAATAGVAAGLGLMLLSMLAARKKARVETPTL